MQPKPLRHGHTNKPDGVAKKVFAKYFLFCSFPKKMQARRKIVHILTFNKQDARQYLHSLIIEMRDVLVINDKQEFAFHVYV